MTEQAAPRVVEAFPHPNYAYAPPSVGLTFWQWCARAIPILVALISSGVLAYFLLTGDRAQLVGNTRQEEGPQTSSSSNAGSEGKEQDQPEQVEQVQAPHDDRAAETQSEPVAAAEQKPIPADLGPRLPMPNDDILLTLIESSVIALNHANITGNYSVLREMGAPAFQNANSPEKLAQIFAQLRGRQLDLSPILIFQPKLFRKPEMNTEGMIRVTGFFPTSPERVNFDLIFQPVNSRWRLYGIAVEPGLPPAAVRQPSLTTTEEPNPPAEKPKPEARTEPEAVKSTPPPTPKKAKPKADAGEAATSVDVRDRLDNPPAPPPAEKPKQKGLWNPFGR